MQTKLTIAIQNILYAGELLEIVIYTLYHHHHLLVAEHSQRIVFHTFRGHSNIRERTHLGKQRVVGRNRLSQHRTQLQLWVETGEEIGHKVVETIEGTEHNDKGHGGHCHSYHRHHTDDVDGMGTLLREEVATGDEKGEKHGLFFQQLVDTI